MPKSCERSFRSRSVVAGVMRSTMPFGNAALAAIQSARPLSHRRATPDTALRATTPLWGMLSQDITVKGLIPASRRRFRPSAMRPKTVSGSSGFFPSAAISGNSGLNWPVAGSMKYPPSVTVIDTMRMAGSASCATMRERSSGGIMPSMAPVTRARLTLASCSTIVVSQSCAFSASCMARSAALTPVPMTAQSRLLALLNSVSR